MSHSDKKEKNGPIELQISAWHFLSWFLKRWRSSVFVVSLGLFCHHTQHSFIFSKSITQLFPKGSELQTATAWKFYHTSVLLYQTVKTPVPAYLLHVFACLGECAERLTACYTGGKQDVCIYGDSLTSCISGNSFFSVYLPCSAAVSGL